MRIDLFLDVKGSITLVCLVSRKAVAYANSLGGPIAHVGDTLSFPTSQLREQLTGIFDAGLSIY